MTITAFVRSTVKGKKAKIRIRLIDGHEYQRFGVVPKIEIMPDFWDNKKNCVKERITLPYDFDKYEINDAVSEAINKIKLAYREVTDKETLPNDWIDNVLSEKPIVQKLKSTNGKHYIIEIFDLYLKESKASQGRKNAIAVTKRILERFIVAKRIKTINQISPAILEDFIRNEHLHNPKQKPRGNNTVTSKLKMLAVFFRYAVKKKLLPLNPLADYELKPEVYGDPICLTKEELYIIHNATTLPKNLLLFRDMFCLQCCCGCRVSDFIKLQKSNLQDGILMYIPEKTLEDKTGTAFIPLPDMALKIINRRKHESETLLFPFPKNIYGKSGYNSSIKKILELLKMERSVVVINTLTQKPETKKLHNVVNTHTARRTFINLNYHQTQDPKLISKMTGHSENSRAFSRYRNIDIDLLKNQIEKAFKKSSTQKISKKK